MTTGEAAGTTHTVRDHPVTVVARHPLQPANKASLTTLDSPTKLGPLDQLVAPFIPVAVVYVYRSPASATTSDALISVERLQHALALLLDHYPHLTGRLRINESDGTPELDRLGTGALLIEAVTNAPLNAFQSPEDGDRIQVTNLPGSGNALLAPYDLTIEGVCRDPVFTVQHTRFACGGVALGVKLPHNLCDAQGFMQLVRHLAEIYRSLRERDSSAESPATLTRPPHIQSYLAQPGTLTPEDRQAVLDFQPPLFFLATAQPAETGDSRAPPPAPAPVPPPIIGRVLRFTGKALDAIKAEATDPSGGWVSTFTALSAHLHQRIYRARLKLGAPPSELHRDFLAPMNLRSALELPSGYFANALFRHITDPSHDLLADGPLWRVAKAIHGITRLASTPQEIRQTLEWIAAQPDKRSIRTHFSGAKGSFMVSQWSKFGMYNGVDFDVDSTGAAIRPALVSPPFSPVWLMFDGLAYFLSTEEESAATSPAIDVNLSLMCGILGLLLHDPEADAAPEICEGLSLLQHRGQDACGVVTCGPKGRFYQCKANGMVRDIFDATAISRLIGGMGVGHVRYPTAGSFNNAEAQPFYVNSPYGIVFAHNGNLINTADLMQYMDASAHRHINTASDSELLLNIFANNLQQTGKFRINEDDIFNAIGGMMEQCKGAYACVAMLAGFGIIAFRDPNGIRPIGMGVRKSGTGKDYLFASESVVADASGFGEWEDVKPGEAVIITRNGGVSRRQVAKPATFAPDIFEYVYFARPDSVLDGVSVYRSRMAMGDALADKVKTVLQENNITVDVVIPVPDTSRVAALNLAQKLQLPYREGFIKNRYVGRTFIMPGQQMRKKNVRRKLNAMALEFCDKVVLLVDDSIVRGTTSKEIIQMAKDVGAKKVIVASCAPAIRYPNVYGIDMPSRTELVAHGRTTEEVATAIGADLVIFQTLSDLESSVRQFNPSITTFDCSVFTGEYVTGGVTQEYLQHIEGLRADNMRGKLKGGSRVVDGVASAGDKEDAVAPAGNPVNGSDDTVGLHNTWKATH